MKRATMPKTAINKYRNLCFRENEVGISKEARVSAPPCYMILAKNPYNPKFGRYIAATLHVRHYF